MKIEFKKATFRKRRHWIGRDSIIVRGCTRYRITKRVGRPQSMIWCFELPRGQQVSLASNRWEALDQFNLPIEGITIKVKGEDY